MVDQIQPDDRLMAHLANIAIRIEGKGQYNIAKFIRATIDSLLRESAFKSGYSADTESIINDLKVTTEKLKEIGFDKGIIANLKLGCQKIANNEISKVEEFPEPIVCRRCGLITVHSEKSHSNYCKRCSADLDSYVIHRPIYWMREFDPMESLTHLKNTPVKYSDLLKRIPPIDYETKPAGNGWSVLEIIKHVKDAESVLNKRVKLILKEDNPLLEFQKVWAWTEIKNEKRETVEGIFEEYYISREETVRILEKVSLKKWWRTAVHEEFGPVNMIEQVSYFAAHEISHIRQISSLFKT